MATEEQFLSGLAEALEVDFSMGMDDEFRDYDDWDSMMFLTLVAYLRQEYTFDLTAEVYNEVDTWRDIYTRLS